MPPARNQSPPTSRGAGRPSTASTDAVRRGAEALSADIADTVQREQHPEATAWGRVARTVDRVFALMTSKRTSDDEKRQIMSALVAKAGWGFVSETGAEEQEIEHALTRLELGIAEERKAMDALLSKLRATRIAV